MSSEKILGDRYKIGAAIGAGGFSAVHECVDIETGEKFAVKVLNKAKVRKSEMEEAFEREAMALKSLTQCQQVTRAVDILQSTRNYYVVMDLAANGSLLQLVVKANGGHGLGAPMVRRYFKQLLLGLRYMHQLNIVHRDIKPENLLLDQWGQVKISDFGFAAMAPTGRKLYRQCGTPQYVAPEVLQEDGYIGQQVDMWSAGVTLYVLLCGQLPFAAHDNEKLFEQIQNGTYPRPRRTDGLAPVPQTALHLLRCLLCKNPEKRWDADRALKHPFVAGYDTFPERVVSDRLESIGSPLAVKRSQQPSPGFDSRSTQPPTSKSPSHNPNSQSQTPATDPTDPMLLLNMSVTELGGESWDVDNLANVLADLRKNGITGAGPAGAGASTSSEPLDDVLNQVRRVTVPSHSCPNMSELPKLGIDVYNDPQLGRKRKMPTRKLFESAEDLATPFSEQEDSDQASEMGSPGTRREGLGKSNTLVRLRTATFDEDDGPFDVAPRSASVQRSTSALDLAGLDDRPPGLDIAAVESQPGSRMTRRTSSAALSTPHGSRAAAGTPRGSTPRPQTTPHDTERFSKPISKRFSLVHIGLFFQFVIVLGIVLVVAILKIMFDVKLHRIPMPKGMRRMVEQLIDSAGFGDIAVPQAPPAKKAEKTE